MPRASFAVGAPVTRAKDFGIGKWSRIATYGPKRQQQEDGSWRDFNFDDAAFAQALRNFKRMFAGRGKGMGSDYEHQTLNAPRNGRPAPNLCFFGSMAVVKNGQVVGQEDVRPGVVPLDAEAEAQRLALENPAGDPSPDGVWVYCSELTEYGEKLIPGYSQLSPLFNDEDTDERDGSPVGLAFQNVSFVNVAFQTGTSFNFSKVQTMNDMAPDMMRKLSKFGFLPEKPETAETAYAAYLEGSEDPAEERKKVAEMYRQMRAKMSAGEPQSDGPGTLPAGAPNATPPELAAPGLMSQQMQVDKDSDGMAKMSKILETQLAAMGKRVMVAEKAASEAAAKLRDREKVEHEGRVAAFKKDMLHGELARYLPEQESDLDALLADVGGDVDKARKHAERMPPLSAFSRMTVGGNPVGMKTVPAPGMATMSRTQRGFAFNKAVKEYQSKNPGATFAEAQKVVAREQPDLYSGSF